MTKLQSAMKHDKDATPRNNDFPIRNLYASDTELSAISSGIAPEVYTYVYGTSKIPMNHRIQAKNVMKYRIKKQLEIRKRMKNE